MRRLEKYDEFLLKRTCIKEGRKKEYDDYVEAKKAALKNIERYKRSYESGLQKLKETKFPPESSAYIDIKENMLRAKYALDRELSEKDFLRPNKSQDIKERIEQGKTFAKKLRALLPIDISLRFHATSIANTEKILKSRMISSSAYRYGGYHASTDSETEISVTNLASLERSIAFHADLYAYQKCLPAGCVFILRTKNKEDAALQFVGIITTQENITRVKKWMREYGYNEDFLYTYATFLEIVRETMLEAEFAEIEKELNKTLEHEIDPHYEPEGIDDMLDKIEENIICDTIVQMNIQNRR